MTAAAPVVSATTPLEVIEAARTGPERNADRDARLNRVNDAVAFKGGFRPIHKDDYRTLKRINHELGAMSRQDRNKAVRGKVDSFYQAVQQTRARTLVEVGSEASTLQFAAAINAGIGISPTLINHFAGLSRTLGGAAGYFAGQLALNAVQPFLNVYTFNAIYSAFDFTRTVGQPGRSGQLEGISAPRLVESFEQLEGAVADLQLALKQAKAGRTEDGTEWTPDQATAAVRNKNRSAHDQLETRYTAEAFADSFEVSRYVQSLLGALRQVMYVASGATKFVMKDQVAAGALSFKLLTYGAAAAQALQVLVAVCERLGESDRIIKKNLAYTEINSKADIRGMGPIGLGGMIRSPYTQVGWAVNDTTDKPISARYAALSAQFNISPTAIRKFDEAGGFNHPKYSQTGGNLPPERKQRLDDFLATCEGTPIAGCRNAYQELEKKAVLEDVTRLLILEDVSKLSVLQALQNSHAPTRSTAGEAPAGTPYAPSIDEVRDALGLASDADALKLMKGPLPADLVDTLVALRTKYDLRTDGSSPDQLEPIRVQLGLPDRQDVRKLLDPANGHAFQARMGEQVTPEIAAQIDTARATFDPVAQDRHDAVLARVRITLKLDSDDDAAELLQGPADFAKAVMPRKLGAELSQLKTKYSADGPFFLLKGTLGFDTLDEAKALRQGLSPDMDALLTQLHDKYETRKSLRPEDVLTFSRETRLELVDSMKATNDPAAAMASVRGMVIGMLFPKFLTSSLNAQKWHVPQETGHAEGDRARIEKSLTPFEHTLLQVALAMPKAVMDFSEKPPKPKMEAVLDAQGEPLERGGRPVMRPIANTKQLNEDMPEPASMEDTRRILKELAELKMDKATVNWDPTGVSDGVADRILAVMETKEGVVAKGVAFGRNWVAINKDRINMPGYLTPAFTVQISRQTLGVLGGTIAYFLIGSLINLANKGLTDKGVLQIDPHTGEANPAKQTFDRVTFGIQAALAIPAVYAALSSGAFSVLSSNLRGKEYFLRTDGRPTFFTMLKEHYPYGANLKGLPWKKGAGASTDHAWQAWPGGEGPALRAAAEGLTAEANAWLDSMLRAPDGSEDESPVIPERAGDIEMARLTAAVVRPDTADAPSTDWAALALRSIEEAGGKTTETAQPGTRPS